MAKLKKNSIGFMLLLGVMTGFILIAGFFAWRGISQVYESNVNTFGTPGGRLHDYFNGVEKQVFIENFTPKNSGVGFENYLYARVRIDEFMQVGNDGLEEESEHTNYENKQIKVLRGDKAKSSDPEVLPTKDDKESWDTYIYDKKHESFALIEGEQIRDYYDLKLGGKTVYMPTFNMDSTSIEPDYNGDLIRVNVEKDSKDEGFKRYTVDASEHDESERIYHVYKGDEKYHYTSVLVVPVDENGNRLEADIDYSNKVLTVYDVEHKARETREARTISMEEWLELTEDKKVGDYWVFDIDGWAYWASPIEPQTATGLLINEIELLKQVPDASYYAINVVSQLATAGDWKNAGVPDENGVVDPGRGLFLEGITEDGLGLLEFIATPESVTQINSLSFVDSKGKSYDENTVLSYKLNDTLELTTKLSMANSTGEETETSIKWSIEEIEGDSGLSQASIDLRLEDNVFSVPKGYESMAGCIYEITATSIFNQTIKASIKVRVFGEEAIMTVEAKNQEQYVIVNDINEYVEFECFNSGNQVKDVTWSVKGNKDSKTVVDRDSGRLTISKDEKPGSKLTVIATSKDDKNVEGTYVITVYGMVNIDAVEFLIIDVKDIEENGEEASLLYSTKMLGSTEFGAQTVGTWETSKVREGLKIWLNQQSTLKQEVIEVEIDSNYEFQGQDKNKKVTTNDTVFLLSEEEFKTYIGIGNVAALSKYDTQIDGGSKYYYLRSGEIAVNDAGENIVTFIDAIDANTGEIAQLPSKGVQAGYRAALWIYL